MKKFLVFVAMVLSIIVLVLLVATTSFAYWNNGNWNKNECDICNKTIYRWIEGSMGGDNMSIYSPRGFILPLDEEEEVAMGLDMQIYVCEECYKKHNMEYRAVLVLAYENWVEIKREEYKQIRLQNAEDRRLKKVKELEEKIEECKKQLEKEVNK